MQLLDLLSCRLYPCTSLYILVISQAEVHQAREECESLAREARLMGSFEASEHKWAFSACQPWLWRFLEAEVGLRAQKQMTALEPDCHVWPPMCFQAHATDFPLCCGSRQELETKRELAGALNCLRRGHPCF